MKATFRIEGLSECQAALEELPRSLQRNALKRVLTAAAEPIRQAASNYAPKASGELASSMVIATKFDSSVGKQEFGRVMRLTGNKAKATAALRDARRQSSSVPIPFVWVGPAKAATKADAIKRMVQEFGSKNQKPQPYMRPAWDTQKDRALENLKAGLMAEIEKTMARFRARAMRTAGKI